MKLLNLIAVIPLVLPASVGLAETGYVIVLVQDAHQHPVRLVEIGIEKGASKLTKDDGQAQLPLAQTIKANDWITFQLVHSPPGKDLAIVSPWNNLMPVPSFADKPENLIKIVVVQRGDRAALESGIVLRSLTEKINKANAPKTAHPQSQPDPKEALLTVAKQYGLNADEVDAAIRALGAKTDDIKEAGIVFLYERNFPKASAALGDSLDQSEKKLQTDQKAVIQDQKDISDTAFFLGQSLYEQGRYRESADAYQRSLAYGDDDAIVLNDLALSLHRAGDYPAAEPRFRHALAIQEAAFGPDSPMVARALYNLAALLQDKGDYAAAEPLYHRALAIDEKALGPDNPEVSTTVNNLALLLKNKGDLAAAEPLYRRALAIDEKALGPDHPDVATDLNNLASLLQDKGDLAAAEPLYRRALAIDEKALGPDHPDVATDLNNLASLLQDKGDPAAAEPLYRRAIAIDEKALGPDHPLVATDLNNLAGLLQDKGDPADAEPLYRRALAIDEKALGPDHPNVAIRLKNLASLWQAKGDLDDAEPLYRRALAIDEKALGPDHPLTIAIRKNLTDLQRHLTPAHQ